MPASSSSSGAQPKPHARDAATSIAAADALCREHDLQFTTLRRSVFKALVEASQPLGAYDLLKRLEDTVGRRIAPATVYRALDFLLDHGLVSRIESNNTFVPCAHPDHPHTCVFLICQNCGTSAEVEYPILEMLVAKDAESLGFRVGKPIIELQGTCASCRAAAAGVRTTSGKAK